VPDERYVFLLQAQRLARGHQDLLFHQVHAREHLRYRVLDLYPGVHLDEVEVISLDQELHRPCVGIPCLPRQPDGGVADPLADLVADAWRGRFFKHLLPTALHGALPLVEVDDVALVIRHHLHLDVVRPGQELLQVNGAIPERRLGFPLCDLNGLAKLLLIFSHPDAASAAPGRRLYHDRIADLLCRLDRLVHRSGLLRAGHHRHVGLFRQPPRR
jgi:hypothetical protein